MPGKLNTLIAGAGYMAKEYARVLKVQGVPFAVAGRSEERVSAFAKDYPEINATPGGVASYLQHASAPDSAIVTVNIEELYNVTRQLIEGGTKYILVEKPGALTIEKLIDLKTLSEAEGASVYIAYNRRFYRSAAAARELIEKDGGIRSAHFEFTEWVHTINPALYKEEVLSKWIISNSSHVIDLAFNLIGEPAVMHTYNSDNSIGWHPSGSVFTGSGVSNRQIPFTYHSDWKSAGRWNIEILTAEHRLYFAPMEKLHIQKRGSVSKELYESDYSADEMYKPGLFHMVDSFFKTKEGLCTLEEQIRNMEYYNRIGGYAKK